MKSRWLLALVAAPLCPPIPFALETFGLYWEALEAERSAADDREQEENATSQGAAPLELSTAWR